jgi:signal transduction histidine kinase/ActR/RegA family two-component response regulator
MGQAFLHFDPSTTERANPGKLILLNLMIAAAYAGTGYAGLRLSFIGESVTLFWPPSGIAFAALFLGGMRMLPGVGLGAFIVNIIGLEHPALALLVAVGNTLPALSATIILRNWVVARPVPDELRRVIWFILVASLGTTVLSATIGTLAVMMAGVSESSIQSTWLVWWMGDAMGVLIVAPPILLWRRIVIGRIKWRAVVDAIAFGLGGIGLIAGLFLIRNPIWAVELCKLFTLLLSLGAGIRFGLMGPGAITLLMAIGGIAVTTSGTGPFVRGGFHDSFALLHSYLFAQAVAGMLLAAALADLRRIAASEAIARAEAEEAATNRIRLLTMISHDVRTPLSGISGVLQTLARSPLAQADADLVALGLRATRTLTALVTDILDVARVDSGRILLTPAPFSPGGALADLVTLQADAARARGLALHLDLDPELPSAVLGDKARFDQIVGNLLTNAIAYTETGAVSITAQWSAGRAYPLTLIVEDTGPGIEPSQVPCLFDAFVLAPRPGQRSDGLGMGLHICAGLCSLMGGSVRFESREGGGSRFIVELALPPTEAAVPRLAPQSVPAMNILIIEDDPIVREVTHALLVRDGHQVCSVDGPAAALQAVSDVVPRLVLIDIQLGSGGAEEGIDLARRLREASAGGPALQIIAFTADATELKHESYRRAGIDGVITKPLELDASLSELLRTARDRLYTE